MPSSAPLGGIGVFHLMNDRWVIDAGRPAPRARTLPAWAGVVELILIDRNSFFVEHGMLAPSKTARILAAATLSRT
jgi:hypothetical protein